MEGVEGERKRRTWRRREERGATGQKKVRCRVVLSQQQAVLGCRGRMAWHEYQIERRDHSMGSALACQTAEQQAHQAQ